MPLGKKGRRLQPGTPDWGGSDIAQEDGDSIDDVLATLTDLIAEIEAAPAGSEALDARIHFGFRVMAEKIQDHATLLISEGISWPTVKAVLDDVVAPFTTSLDAALVGEHIVFVIRSAKRRRWGAMQRATCGEEVLAWAQTEPLARRLAALMSWRADLVATLEEQEARARKEPDGAARSQPTQPVQDSPAPRSLSEAKPETTGPPETVEIAEPDEEPGEEKDWEVLF